MDLFYKGLMEALTDWLHGGRHKISAGTTDDHDVQERSISSVNAMFQNRPGLVTGQCSFCPQMKAKSGAKTPRRCDIFCTWASQY